MLSIIPVSLVTMPYAILSLFMVNKTIRTIGILTLLVVASTRNYRPGEGWLSHKMNAPIREGEDIGGILFELSAKYECLKRFQGKTFSFTSRESESLARILEAVQENEKAIPILEDFLDQYPKGRVVERVS